MLPDRAALVSLSPRERACLGGVAALLDSKSIARELKLSSKTVDNHIERAMRKLGAANRRDAALWLAERDPTAVWERFPKGSLRLDPSISVPHSTQADVVEEQRLPFVMDAQPPSKGRSRPFTLLVLIFAAAAALAVLLVAMPQLARNAQELADRIKPPH